MHTAADEIEVEILHDDENHFMRIVATNTAGQYMLARNSWGSAVKGYPVPAVASVPCEVWNVVVDLVAAAALLDVAQNLTHEATAMLNGGAEEDE